MRIMCNSLGAWQYFCLIYFFIFFILKTCKTPNAMFARPVKSVTLSITSAAEPMVADEELLSCSRLHIFCADGWGLWTIGINFGTWQLPLDRGRSLHSSQPLRQRKALRKRINQRNRADHFREQNHSSQQQIRWGSKSKWTTDWPLGKNTGSFFF